MKEIENLLETGEIALENLQGFQQLENRILVLENTPLLPSIFDDRFYQMVKREKKEHKAFHLETLFLMA